MRLITLCAASLLLAGCAAREQLPDYSQSAERDLPATHFETVITGRDGTRLSATVFQPALRAGEQAPLVVHTHGWGGWRVTGPNSFYGTQIMSGRAALTAWRVASATPLTAISARTRTLMRSPVLRYGVLRSVR